MIRLTFLLLLLSACQMITPDKDTPIMEIEKNLHHFNFRTAFMSGYYEGDYTLQQVVKKGDFGLGTFNNLDGEMIVLDGKIYRATTDGDAVEVKDLSEKTPSAMVTFFKADQQVVLKDLTREGLLKWLEGNLDIRRDMYALKVTGTFESLRARSQHPVYGKPFPEIKDIVDNMVYHDLEEVSGTLVGFQLPSYLGNVNYPGLHFHFIGNTTAPFGGCAPGFSIKKATLSIMKLNSFSVDVPQSPAYYQLEMDSKKNEIM